jgi:hypothetical protein
MQATFERLGDARDPVSRREREDVPRTLRDIQSAAQNAGNAHGLWRTIA